MRHKPKPIVTDAERSAYSRGYQAGGSRWPLHRPPVPPDPIIGALVRALQELRDAGDFVCSNLSNNDEWFLLLNPKVDAADDALTSLSAWLLKHEEAIVIETNFQRALCTAEVMGYPQFDKVRTK